MNPATDVRRRRAAAYAVCTSGDALLLTQLWDRDVSPGQWTLPGGGMSFGESPEETVLRELFEETGLRGTVSELLDVRSEVFPAWKEHPALHVVGFIFAVAASGSPAVVEQGGSTVAAEWVALSEVRSRPIVGLVEHALELLA